MGYGFSKCAPHDRRSTLGGVRLLLPVGIWRKRGYDINVDEFRVGWWLFCLALDVDGIGYFGTDDRGHPYGVSVRLCWGWNWSTALNPKDQAVRT